MGFARCVPGRTLVKMNRIQDLLKQLRKTPNRPDLHQNLGRLYMQQGNRGEAVRHFLSAARLFSDRRSPSRNLNKAVVALKKMVRDFPENHDSHYMLGEVYTEMEDVPSAVETYRALSGMYEKAGKLLMAVSVHDKITNIDPDNIDAWEEFARLNRESGMPYHAAQAHISAASLMARSGREAEAYELIVNALELDPENAGALDLLGDLMKGEGKFRYDRTKLMALADELEREGQTKYTLNLLSRFGEITGDDTYAVRAAEIKARTEVDSDSKLEETSKISRSYGIEGAKVLVIDDEKEILLLLEQILKAEGFSVLTARDGQEGYEIFKRERPPLVISDAMLPKLHGFDLCRRIKEESNQAAKVMILTAVYKKYKYKGKVEKEFNVDEYMDKPFQITEFLDTFHRMARDVPQILEELERVPDGEEVSAEGISVMVAGDNDRELSDFVARYCNRKLAVFQSVPDAREMVLALEENVPDIILMSDDIQGMEPFTGAWLTRAILGVRSSTLVLVCHHPESLRESSREFNHIITAPVTDAILDEVVRVHLQHSERWIQSRKEKRMSAQKRRAEATVRSKVDRILKSQFQIENRYTEQIRKLEQEIKELKTKLWGS